MAELTRWLRLPFHTENANSVTDARQHTLTNTCLHMYTLHFIYFQGMEGTQVLLLESTEAFYRTALRQGHCATQAHSGRSSLTPPYTPMGDNGKGGYILPRRWRKRMKGRRKKRAWRSGRIKAVSRSSVHQCPPLLFTPLCLILLLCYLGGYVKHTHMHTHYKHQQWHIQRLQVITWSSIFKHRSLRGICRPVTHTGAAAGSQS